MFSILNSGGLPAEVKLNVTALPHDVAPQVPGVRSGRSRPVR